MALDSTAAALLAAVIADPEDVGVRLVYADWLEEHDEPERAEFVRVQVELAAWVGRDEEHCPKCGQHWRWRVGAGWGEWSDCQGGHRWCSVRYLALRRREQELIGAHGHEWCPVPIRPFHGAYRRGFVEEVALTCAKWLAHGRELVRLAPLRVVRLTDREPHEFQGRYAWYDDRRTGDWALAPHYLPACLYGQIDWTFDFMADPPETSLLSAKEAHAALSAACLTWARGNP